MGKAYLYNVTKTKTRSTGTANLDEAIRICRDIDMLLDNPDYAGACERALKMTDLFGERLKPTEPIAIKVVARFSFAHNIALKHFLRVSFSVFACSSSLSICLSSIGSGDGPSVVSSKISVLAAARALVRS